MIAYQLSTNNTEDTVSKGRESVALWDKLLVVKGAKRNTVPPSA